MRVIQQDQQCPPLNVTRYRDSLSVGHIFRYPLPSRPDEITPMLPVWDPLTYFQCNPHSTVTNPGVI
jgi:hypothetical protein